MPALIVYLKPGNRPQTCIVAPCSMKPKRWGSLCNCHYTRWREHGSFATPRERFVRALDKLALAR
jgi:hypothetical protein